LDPATAQLWCAGKEFVREELVKDRVGRNEKTKVVVKLQKPGHGAPAREPCVSEAERKVSGRRGTFSRRAPGDGRVWECLVLDARRGMADVRSCLRLDARRGTASSFRAARPGPDARSRRP